MRNISEQSQATPMTWRVVLTVIVSAVLMVGGAEAQKIQTFRLSGARGANPVSNISEDSSGTLYGTALDGGAHLCGSVFKFDNTGKLTVLYAFGSQATDGCNPSSGVIFDSQRNLYGTTSYGGANGMGTVYKLSQSGQETVLYSFGAGTDGQNPASGLVMDANGNLYGTTYYGGNIGAGTVFKLAPTGKETVLYSFDSVGGFPVSQPGLTMDAQGNLYGTTSEGGTFSGGIVFRLDPAGNITVLFNFGGCPGDGLYPYGGLVLDKAGNLYGTAYQGGTYFLGMVYKLDSSGNETILYNFGGGFDGENPYAGLTMDQSGNLYGVTASGGIGLCAGGTGCGTVFEIDPSGHESVLHSFGGSDGTAAEGTLLLDVNSGALYGTAYSGGRNGCGGIGCGTVFKLNP